MFRAHSIFILALLTALLFPWKPALAQQTFTLGRDDTWVPDQPPEPGSPEGQIAAARQALASRRFERADYLATRWIDRHPNHPLLPEAYLVRADALNARKDYYKALFDYEYIARTAPGSEPFVAALQRELDIAKLFIAGTKRKLWGLRIVDASDDAEEILIRIQERLPGSRLAEDAGMTLADFYFTRRRMSLAAEMYAIFVDNYPQSEHLVKARKRLIYAHLASFKGPEFDPAGLYEARARLHELKIVAPAAAQDIGADALLTRIDESDALKLLETSRWYLRTGDPVAAELTIRRLVRQYPRAVAAADAMRLIPQLLPRLPDTVLQDAPDYAALRAAILGIGPASDTPQPATPDDQPPPPQPAP